MNSRSCIDCEPALVPKPAPFPGPRCHVHHRDKEERQKLDRAGKRLEKVYGITRSEYDAIYAAQGGRCYICRKATGRTKSLAVDHDHRYADADWRSVRALLCGPCNRMVVGRLGIAGLRRAIEVIELAPAQDVLRSMREDERP